MQNTIIISTKDLNLLIKSIQNDTITQDEKNELIFISEMLKDVIAMNDEDVIHDLTAVMTEY